MFTIYKILNLVNNKVYIGYTGKDINWYMKRRFTQAEHGHWKSRMLYNAIRKYGSNNFTYKILEMVTSIKEAKEKEVHFIKEYNSYYQNNKGYNMTFGGDGGACIMTEEIKQKIRDAWTKEKRKLHSEKRLGKPGMCGKLNPRYGIPNNGPKNGMYGKEPWNKGKPCSSELLDAIKERARNPESRRKKSESKMGKKNPNYGKPETAKNFGDVSGGNNGRAKKVIINGIEYSCMKEAMKKLNLKRRQVQKYINSFWSNPQSDRIYFRCKSSCSLLEVSL